METRTQKSLLTAKVNAICWFATIVVSFFSRKILLDNLGVEFMGLAGTLGSILTFLNVAEFGIGTVISVVLYKPLFDNKRSSIQEIVSVLGYLYRCIGLFILGAGIITSLFLPVIFSNTSFDWLTIYFGFYAFLCSSLIGYFVNYRSVLLSADQRNYVVAGYFQVANTVKACLQMLLAIYWHSFILYFSLELIFGLICAYLLNIKINQTYPWLKTEVRLGRTLLNKYPEVAIKAKQVMVHNTVGFAVYSAMPLLVYIFISLPMVAIYSNYMLVISSIQNLLSTILDGTSASIGNLIAEGNRDNTLKVYQELFSFRFFCSVIFAGGVFFLLSDFITLWLGKEFQLSLWVLGLMTLHMFLLMVRKITDQFIDGYGLFQDVWSPIVEVCLLLSVSIIGGINWGLIGLLCGPIASTLLIIYVWKPYFLFRKGFHLPIRKYLWMFSKHFFALAVAIGVVALIAILTSTPIISTHITWGMWLIKASIFTLSLAVILFIAQYTLTSSTRTFVARWFKRNS
ncbi:MAG: sugar transporter [Bacteroidales bacterium]|nr:sugar transporter [Bacteroidales bacterium]